MTDEITTMERKMERQKRAIKLAGKEKEKQLIDIATVETMLRTAGIQVPKDFKQIIGETPGFIQKGDVRELLKITAFWKPYVGGKNYNEFVVNICARFLRVHALALNNNPACEKLYVGEYANLEGIPLMKELVTTVLSSGYAAHFVHTSSRWHFNEE